MVAGSAAGGLLPAPARAQPGRGLRVAIVGGGLAGLAAALTLADARVRSTVYEASLSVGGRIHSNTTYWDDAQVTEWCGEFVNSDHATVLGLARRFRIETIDLPLQSPVGADETFLLDGQRYPEADALRDFRPVHAALTRDARAAGPRTTAASTPPGVWRSTTRASTRGSPPTCRAGARARSAGSWTWPTPPSSARRPPSSRL